ncbi:DUF1501 domain-containing protein [Telmatocola sphagniphila]|uniref:DUF1501 domain-containing protein n=1 Tax=Telmatocola sphagniphila TaxID=1123043 RepID=A0A8E6ES92_9BACT|nr:DUF1501 domain-containing protein [Telmatocola sphagniphila]QVL30364.1 DUF1501 domain-containing protein [Telmatocola sphagniphila]
MTPSHFLSHAGRHLLDRRSFLRDGGTGLGGIALISLLAERRLLAADPIRPVIRPEAPLAPRAPHFEAKAKRVLMIFCSGAVSHLDTFDYKPELYKWDGKPLPGAEKETAFQGGHGNLTKPLWNFKPRGQSGKMISDLMPNIAELADDLCFIHSMTAKTNTHGPAENQMSTGYTIDGFPSIGSWVSYALGSECRDLPAFVAIPDPRGVPQVGPNNWNNAFLPAVFQGTAFNTDKPIPHLNRPSDISADTESAVRDFVKQLNEKHLERHPGDTELSARIASMELAAKMQLRAPEVTDFSKETHAIKESYGVNDKNPIKAGFARNCLLARRLLERNVRFVQLFNGAYAMGEGVGNWDGHKTLKKFYDTHGPILDQPCAALIKDLKQRGMLKDTLVVWVTEFGRMPTFQKAGATGRDHNPKGFTVWMAGAGVKKGFSYGATDEFGYAAVEKKSSIYDLHATILHLLGLNHERLSFYHNGIERRLTDVHGEVLKGILA